MHEELHILLNIKTKILRESFMDRGVPVLLYHRIDHSGLSTATPPQVFRQHLEWLSERGWRAIGAEEFGYFMRGGKALPPRSFLITFDDGYASMASAALPILQEFRYPAIGFVATEFLRAPDTKTACADDAEAVFLSWPQVRALQAGGLIDIQSHTHTHRRFAGCSVEEIATDLATSLDLLTHELALPRSHFTHLAWPWGKSKPEWRAAAARSGFRYQYTVARSSFRPPMPLDEVPRTCFDASEFTRFQLQFWLQCGHFSPLWEAAYPYGRKLWQLTSLLD